MVILTGVLVGAQFADHCWCSNLTPDRLTAVQADPQMDEEMKQCRFCLLTRSQLQSA
jgi:hypothetical protein